MSPLQNSNMEMKSHNYIPLLLFAITLFACKDNVEQLASVADKIDKRAKVEVAKVEQRSDAMPIKAIGRLASDKEVKLSFKIGGVIEYMRADEGQQVRKGQTLAAVRTNEIDAQVMKAKQALTKAERDLERVKKMYEEEAATLENVQDLTTLVEVSQADLEIAQFNQKYAKIVSPVSGRILRRLAEPNELISPGQPIFLLASSGGKAFVMKAALSDKDMANISYGDTATAYFDAFPNEAFKGTVSLIAENADPRTGTYEVEINFSPNGKRLRNGLFGRVEIQPKASAAYYTIPMAALVEADEQAMTIFVPSKDGQTAREIQVKPIQIQSDYIAIEAPELENFETVITSGAPYLIDGDSILVRY